MACAGGAAMTAVESLGSATMFISGLDFSIGYHEIDQEVSEKS